MHPPSRRRWRGVSGPPSGRGSHLAALKTGGGGTETALEGPGGVIAPESVLRGSRAGLAVAGFVWGLPGPRLPALPPLLPKSAAFE